MDNSELLSHLKPVGAAGDIYTRHAFAQEGFTLWMNGVDVTQRAVNYRFNDGSPDFVECNLHNADGFPYLEPGTNEVARESIYGILEIVEPGDQPSCKPTQSDSKAL